MSEGAAVSIHRRRQTRRKIGLEMLSLVASIGSAVFFSGLFVARWSSQTAVAVTLIAAVALILYGIWFRSRYPPNINPPVADVRKKDDDDEGDGWWEWYWILAFVVAWAGMVIVGLATSFFLAFLVIAVFGVGYSDVSDVGDVVRAALAMLAISAAVEFAVVIPLSKRWNLDFEADPEPRSTYCPTPFE